MVALIGPGLAVFFNYLRKNAAAGAITALQLAGTL